MPLTRETWPRPADVAASLAAAFALPAHPGLDAWTDWCRAAGDRSMHLEGIGRLDGVRTVDGPSLLRAMEGYRFVLDIAASEPGRLVWHDQGVVGGWQPHWVVLQGCGGDALIGDLRDPALPVLHALHGMGRWAPEPQCASVQALMDRIALYTPLAPGEGPPAVFHTVRLTGLGPEPMRVLTALKQLPAYADLAGARLFALRQQLPLMLVDDTISASMKDHVVACFAALGAQVEVTERLLPRDTA